VLQGLREASWVTRSKSLASRRSLRKALHFEYLLTMRWSFGMLFWLLFF